MRSAGFTTDEIAKKLGIKPASVKQLMWRGSKAGFLEDKHGNFLLDDPKDEVEFSLAHKVVKNIGEMLDSERVLEKGQRSVKQDVTLAVFKETLAKRFEPQQQQPGSTNMAIVVNVQMPDQIEPMREGSIGGVPFIDAEPVEDGDGK